jgi:selenocysteine lyase/cysteine desulfurase
LAHQLHEGLVKQGHRMFTPPRNRSSIVTFYCDKPMASIRSAFGAANIELTVRGGQVRVAPALFNNSDEIERCLEVSRKLV